MNVAFLIVTFEPNKDEFLIHLNRNLNAASQIIIVDNSNEIESISFIASLVNDRIVVIQNFENIGIAEAQNIGFSKFLEQGGEYLVQLDQDSSMDKNSLNILMKYYGENSNSYKIAGVGPGPIRSVAKSVRHLKSAGLLIHRSSIQDIGFLQSDLFIDLVDYEWCWRAKKKGYSFHSVPCEFFHQLGMNYKIFGMLDISIPSPIRHYYQVRNSLRLICLRKPPLLWSIARIPILLTKLILYPILLPEGKLRMIYMLMGILHFFQGKKGKIIC